MVAQVSQWNTNESSFADTNRLWEQHRCTLLPHVPVLVVGAGISGAAAAILLARDGVGVDLIDIKPDISALGSGITLQGNALRVLRELGVWEQVHRERLRLRHPRAAGARPGRHLDRGAPGRPTGGPDLPARSVCTGPTWPRSSSSGGRGRGARSVSAHRRPDRARTTTGVDVTFSDGTAGRYDLVIGADGLRSATRQRPRHRPETEPTGMGIWRVFARGPASITRTDLYLRRPGYIAGYCPTGPDTPVRLHRRDGPGPLGMTPDEQLATMRELSPAYHGPWDDIRDRMTDPDRSTTPGSSRTCSTPRGTAAGSC